MFNGTIRPVAISAGNSKTRPGHGVDCGQGLLVLDPKTARIETLLGTFHSESFKGLNDLHFAQNGDLYFTDQRVSLGMSYS